MLAWLYAALHALEPETDLDDAYENLWDEVAFMTRYGRATLTEALTELDQTDRRDFIAATGRLIKDENAKRDT